MMLLVRSFDGAILAASNIGQWQVPDFAAVIAVPGDAEAYKWPHSNGASACMYQAGTIVSDRNVQSSSADPLEEKIVSVLRERGLVE